MKVVTYNIRYGLGLDGQFDLGRIAGAVEGADIVALQEVERFWRRSGNLDQAARLGELLPELHWIYFPAFDVDTSLQSDSNDTNIRRRQFGPMLMSRWPIRSARYLPLPQLATREVLGMSTGAVQGVIETPLGTLQIYSLHLSAASNRERLLQIDALLATHAQITKTGAVCTGTTQPDDPVETEHFAAMDWYNGEPPPPVPSGSLFLGDFNSTEDSQEYTRMVGIADPVYGPGIHPDDLIDTWSAAKTRVGDSTTWWPDPPNRTPGSPMRLDYCFASAALQHCIARAWVDSEANGSDHKPYWIEFEQHSR